MIRDKTAKRLHEIWDSMHKRCYNQNNQSYHNYGERGITICDEWSRYKTPSRMALAAFKQWAISNGYGDSLQIDRIDNDNGYSPANCRWITSKEQARNRRSNVVLEAFGECKILLDWVNDDRCKVTYATLRNRIKMGWSGERVLTTPSVWRVAKPKVRKQVYKSATMYGETKLVTHWANDSRRKVKRQTFLDRVYMGWDAFAAFNLPIGSARVSAA